MGTKNIVECYVDVFCYITSFVDCLLRFLDYWIITLRLKILDLYCSSIFTIEYFSRTIYLASLIIACLRFSNICRGIIQSTLFLLKINAWYCRIAIYNVMKVNKRMYPVSNHRSLRKKKFEGAELVIHDVGLCYYQISEKALEKYVLDE